MTEINQYIRLQKLTKECRTVLSEVSSDISAEDFLQVLTGGDLFDVAAEVAFVNKFGGYPEWDNPKAVDEYNELFFNLVEVQAPHLNDALARVRTIWNGYPSI